MSSNLDGGVVVELHDQLDERPLLLGLAPFPEQLPKDHSVHRVVGFLEVNQQVELVLLWAVYFIQESACVNCSGLPFFETCLIDLRLDQVWRLRLDSLKDGLLHDLG